MKPKAFDESDSDTSDGECDHCSGHVEKKPKNKSNANSSGDAKDSGTGKRCMYQKYKILIKFLKDFWMYHLNLASKAVNIFFSFSQKLIFYSLNEKSKQFYQCIR